MQDLVIGNGTVVTLGEKNRLIPNAAVAVNGGKIVEVGPIAEFVGKYPGARFLDARGRLIMPGFINTHMHFYSSLARGMALEGFNPKNFQEVLEQLWWRLDKALNLEDVKYSALVALVECIRKGTTSVIDHHASPNAVTGSLDVVAGAVLQAGIRACLCYEVSDRDGKDVARQGIEENQRFLERCASHAEETRLAGAFGLHASFTVSDDTLQKSAAVCDKLNAPIHIHMAEGTVDVERSVELFKARPLARLDKAGLLKRPALLAHCIHLDESEHALLAQRKAWALHNPQSNMNNAVGTAPVSRMLSGGVNVSLGTDGMTSDMLQEARAFGLLHKSASGDPKALSLDEMSRVLRNNAVLASSFFRMAVGEIATGAAADMVILDYVPPTPLTEDNFMGHFFFGMVGARVDSTIANGQLLMHEGRLLTLDENEIAAKARELAHRMWQRVE